MSIKVLFAKGPSGPGFKRVRSTFPPIPIARVSSTAATSEYPDFIGYPVATVYKGGWGTSFPDFKPGRPYYNMKLEDYSPYRALGPKPLLYGPEPYRPSLCGCGLYRIAENMCICCMDCMRKPLLAWALTNPEAFNAKQKEMGRWYWLSTLWMDQQRENDMRWDAVSSQVRFEFQCLQDDESPIGCAYCEREGRDACECECEDCGCKHACRCDDYCDDFY